jgi:hypothetical protein
MTMNEPSPRIWNRDRQNNKRPPVMRFCQGRKVLLHFRLLENDVSVSGKCLLI